MATRRRGPLGRRERLGRFPAFTLALVLGASLGLAACDDAAEPGPKPPGKPATITFGVYGPPAEVAVYQNLVDTYNDSSVSVTVQLKSWPDRLAMLADLESGAQPPDVFQASRTDLVDLEDAGLTTPVGDLLDERGVNRGEVFKRAALESFSSDDTLQCMPYNVSTMVMYYNTDLIDFDKMAERDLPAPVAGGRWSFEEFAAAAKFASRPRQGTKGVYVDADLRSLAPFLLSGGGKVFDDDDDPTSLAFSDDDNREPLLQTLELLREPTVTLSDRQLSRATPLEYFERGKLGMIEGFRGLTPELRKVPGLHFDVMPMPIIDDAATVGDISGLCLAAGGQVNRGADFLVKAALSIDGYSTVAEAGYLVPASDPVARSDAFLQPDQQPAHAGVFNASADTVRLLPLLDDYPELARAISPALDELLTNPRLDLDAVTAEIDELSRTVLDPDYEPTDDPASPSTEGSTSESPSEPSESSSEDSSTP